MSEQEDGINYGYQDDASNAGGGLQFGLNAGVTNMIKFEFNPNGGADGAAQEALDVVFNVSERDVSYRMFPVTKAFVEGGEEVSDLRHPAMRKAIQEFNAVVVHILKAFVDEAAIKTALTVPITSFQQFCSVAKAILPTRFETINLDIFAQWQWIITGDNDKTYLRLPKNMKHGKWLIRHVQPVGGQWKELRLNDTLAYEDGEGNKHPFTRQKWFMTNKFATQQKEEGIPDAFGSATHTATTPAAPAVDGAASPNSETPWS